MLKNLYVVYFSPTGGTKKAALALGRNLADHIHEIDLSLPDHLAYHFEKEDVVLFAAPVFVDRIPALNAEKIKTCHGNGAAAITIVAYGNRAYGDALLELNDCVKAQDFRVFASSAVITEHSMVHTVATGRPDAADKAVFKEFAKQILTKFETDTTEPTVAGKHPYTPLKKLPATPVVSEDCVKCGRCVTNCPTLAIPKENPKTTELALCMLCMRCIVNCPKKARSLPEKLQAMMNKQLAPLETLRHDNELFI
ncbi:MAG: EFR1 family ferrodoxin [Evtepia sp.]